VAATVLAVFLIVLAFAGWCSMRYVPMGEGQPCRPTKEAREKLPL
jgi:hypothetical protein